MVVVAIIALLLSILIPVLSRAKGATRSTQCLSNQRQLMTGWYAAMADNNQQIPYILPIGMPPNSPKRDHWWGMLAEQFPDLQQPVYGQGIDAGNPVVCPAIESEFQRPHYLSVMFGYSINGRWSACGPIAEHSRRRWDAIPNPSDYPWLADPDVRNKGGYLTDSVFGKRTATNWGLGFYHPNESGNTVFADGHATSNNIEVLELGQACGTPDWLLAVHSR